MYNADNIQINKYYKLWKELMNEYECFILKQTMEERCFIKIQISIIFQFAYTQQRALSLSLSIPLALTTHFDLNTIYTHLYQKSIKWVKNKGRQSLVKNLQFSKDFTKRFLMTLTFDINNLIQGHYTPLTLPCSLFAQSNKNSFKKGYLTFGHELISKLNNLYLPRDFV